MIGISVGDIIKLLDQVPIWKTVSALPKRVRELEERVAALEAKPTTLAADACPLCGEPMKVTQAAPHRQQAFRMLGIQDRTLACTVCAHTERRVHDPNGALSAKR